MSKLLEILDKFSQRRLLVIGDLMLDRFIWGDVERISPEAPVPVLRVTGENFRMGGAANVMHNIRSLGGKVNACGVVGRDPAGRTLLQRLKQIGISTSGVYSYGWYTTVQKNRIIAGPGHQQIVRLDRESSDELRESARSRLREFVMRQARQCDGIVISDYGKGVIHPELLSLVADLVSEKNLICVVDPKKENYPNYRRPTLITPNRAEASEASGIMIRDQESLAAAGKKLLRMWQASAVMITRGGEGMTLFRPRVEARHFPTQPRDIFDVTGAGDTVVAVCALALASGAGYEEAAVIANVAAGTVGDEVGTVAVPIRKLKRLVREM
jgi:D-beta-D-heptose 7-phosphate kinase/D-beta-D-heptose 1-phosphate adenosyltransferase